MKLRNTAVLAALTLSLLGGAGVAVAQETPAPTPSCAEALGVLTDAQNADAAARRDDKIASDAAKAVTDTEKVHADLGAARAELAAAVKADNDAQLSADSQRTKDAKAAVTKLEADVAKLQDLAGLRAQATGAKANADKTDAAKTGAALVAARTAANEACDGQPADPDPGNENPGDENPGTENPGSENPGNGDGTENPAGNEDPAPDNGGSDNGSVDDGLNPGPITSTNGESVYVPSGGVETGGGPA